MRKGRLISDGERKIVEDIKTGEPFLFKDEVQASYLERKLKNNEFNFIDVPVQKGVDRIMRAHVLTKEASLSGFVSDIAPLANEYGKYVASQKAAGETVKWFEDWYFEVSI